MMLLIIPESIVLLVFELAARPRPPNAGGADQNALRAAVQAEFILEVSFSNPETWRAVLKVSRHLSSPAPLNARVAGAHHAEHEVVDVGSEL